MIEKHKTLAENPNKIKHSQTIRKTVRWLKVITVL